MQNPVRPWCNDSWRVKKNLAMRPERYLLFYRHLTERMISFGWPSKIASPVLPQVRSHNAPSVFLDYRRHSFHVRKNNGLMTLPLSWSKRRASRGETNALIFSYRTILI